MKKKVAPRDAVAEVDEAAGKRAIDALERAFVRLWSKEPEPTAEEQLTRAYEARVRGLKLILDDCAKFLGSSSPELRALARTTIDRVAEVIDGSSKQTLQRIALLSSIDDVCHYIRGNVDDDGAELLLKFLDTELRLLLTREDASMAIAVWRDDRPRPSGLVGRYKFLASLFKRIGLGDVKPDTLERDWRSWCAENCRLRDLKTLKNRR